MIDWTDFITLHYSIAIVFIQLSVCLLLWRLTKDTRTWSLLVIGSILSIIARTIIWSNAGATTWIDDSIRAASITTNTIGFFSLYFLLKKLVQDSFKKREN